MDDDAAAAYVCICVIIDDDLGSDDLERIRGRGGDVD